MDVHQIFLSSAIAAIFHQHMFYCHHLNPLLTGRWTELTVVEGWVRRWLLTSSPWTWWPQVNWSICSRPVTRPAPARSVWTTSASSAPSSTSWRPTVSPSSTTWTTMAMDRWVPCTYSPRWCSNSRRVLLVFWKAVALAKINGTFDSFCHALDS